MNEKKDAGDYLSWVNEFLDLIMVAIIVKIAAQAKPEFKYDLYHENYDAFINALADVFILYVVVYALFLGITGTFA